MRARARVAMLALLVAAPAVADTFRLQAPDDGVVGASQYATIAGSETLVDVAVRTRMGYTELRLANPALDPWLPPDGARVLLPRRFVLPDAPREGIVVNVPEMRLYYYPGADAGGPRLVVTYPVSIGRQDWATPHGVTRVVAKVRDPAWYPPASIRREHAERGDPLPRVVPAGPENPLGRHALRLGLPGYLIHGTNRPNGIGMRVTHGCIRLYPDDVAELYASVPTGTPVRLVNQPVKVGLDEDGSVWLEVHPSLPEATGKDALRYTAVVERVIALLGGRAGRLDWLAVRAALHNADGVPVRVGRLAAGETTVARR